MSGATNSEGERVAFEVFEIELRSKGEWGLERRVTESPCDRTEPETANREWDDAAFDELLIPLTEQVRWSSREKRETRERKQQSPQTAPETIDLGDLGRRLAREFLGGEVLRSYERACGQVGHGRLALRLAFLAGDEDGSLAARPWEFALDGEVALGRRSKRPLIRRMGRPSERPPISSQERIRALVIAAAPRGEQALAVAEEIRAIKSGLEALGRELAVEVCELGGRQTALALRERLLDDREPIHVVHFIGHGSFPREEEQGQERSEPRLLFEDEHQEVAEIAGWLLAEVLQGIESLRLVVLNSCWSGVFPRKKGNAAISGVAAAIASRGAAPWVIAMQFPISDEAAILFSRAFYRRLAAGAPVEGAVAEARLALVLDDPETLEWATPIVLSGGEGGPIFAPRDATPSVPQTRGVSKAPSLSLVLTPLRLGIVSFTRSGEEVWGSVKENAEAFLDLSDLFDGRFIQNPTDWNGVIRPRVEAFLREHAVAARRPIVLDLAAHSSVAFAVGHYLSVKSGLDLTVIQRFKSEQLFVTPMLGPAHEGPLWCDSAVTASNDPESNDTAVGISVTRPIDEDVAVYLEGRAPRVRRVLPMTVWPRAMNNVVRDGTHAFELAASLVDRVRKETVRERGGVVHLFGAVPNAFFVFLGQLSHPLGRIQLYEFDLKDERPDEPRYRPSITYS